MTETATDPAPQPEPRCDVTGVPYSDYVRTVTFVDAATDEPDGEPVHLGTRLLLDGEPTDVRVLLGGGFTITGGGKATIVSFLVHPEDCHIGRVTRHENGYAPDFDLPTIGGRRVLTPFPEPAWSTEHIIDPGRTAAVVPGWATAEPQYEWVRVYLYVSEVSCVRAQADTKADA